MFSLTDIYVSRDTKLYNKLFFLLNSNHKKCNISAGHLPNESFWTSGSTNNYHLSQDTHYWEPSMKLLNEVGFEYWAPNEPSDYFSDDCIEISGLANHMWNITFCNLKRLFICEFQPCVDKPQAKHYRVEIHNH
jgi:hypothetical protein